MISTLVAISSLLYILHFIWFRDLHHIWIWSFTSLAFLPISALVVTLLINRVLTARDKAIRLDKLNMLIGLFFSNLGSELLLRFSDADSEDQYLRNHFGSPKPWCKLKPKQAQAILCSHPFGISITRTELADLKSFLIPHTDFLMRHVLMLGVIVIASLCAQSTSADDIWAGDKPLPDYRNLRILQKVEHRSIHEGDADYRFLLGVSIVEHKGKFYSTWGASAKDENDAKSVFAYKTSQDGQVWSEMKLVAPNPDGPDAHSHGVLLSDSGVLWAFAPRAQFGDITEYPNLRMEVFQFDETKGRWESKGETAKGILAAMRTTEDGRWQLDHGRCCSAPLASV